MKVRARNVIQYFQVHDFDASLFTVFHMISGGSLVVLLFSGLFFTWFLCTSWGHILLHKLADHHLIFMMQLFFSVFSDAEFVPLTALGPSGTLDRKFV